MQCRTLQAVRRPTSPALQHPMFQAAQQLTAQERLTTRTDEDLMSKAVGMRLAVLVVTNSDVVKSMSVMEASSLLTLVC